MCVSSEHCYNPPDSLKKKTIKTSNKLMMVRQARQGRAEFSEVAAVVPKLLA